ncbi:MAG: c-type cytochrome domain-containing protein [Chloroflexota bacterium]
MSSQTQTYQRFPIARRIEHIIMAVSFGMLGLTGLPQKFPTLGISIFITNIFENVEILRLVHHISATIMMLGIVWHLLVAGYKIFVTKEPMTMLPVIKDAVDGIQVLLFNLGIGKKFPQMGRFNFEEKLEYWAFVWGAAVMGLTGFMMWNPLMTLKILPGEVIPAAKAAHGGEAILAVAAIIIWHMYSVHIRKFNKSMFTGKLDERDMLHEHPLELADLKAGLAGPRVTNPTKLRKRKAVYFPIASIFAVIMLGAIYGFVNGENTALTTRPPASNPIPVYFPQTPTPMPTKIPLVSEGPLNWENYAGPLFQEKCTSCHGSLALGGLSLETYANAMLGGNHGPVIVPSNSGESNLVVIQSKVHMGQLTPEELDNIIKWIDDGAPEK